MITLRPAAKGDLRVLFDLKVRPDQASFVAPNEITLAEAPFEKGSAVFCICDDDAIVGLIALVDSRQQDDLEPEDDPQCAFLWRLMVAPERQGRGIGRAAVEQAMEWARQQGNPRIETSAVHTNAGALSFYEGLGFHRTGRMDGDEVVLSREL